MLSLLVGVVFIGGLKIAHILRAREFAVCNWGAALEFERALLPLLILAPACYFIKGFTTPIVFILVIGVCMLRIASIWPSRRLLCHGAVRWLGGKTTTSILFLCFAVFVLYGTIFQIRVYNAIFLSYDWCFYLDVVENTLQGKWFYSNVLGRNYMGQHFEPGTILLLIPYVFVFKSTTAFFLMNATVVGSGCLALYALAIRKGLGCIEALAVALMYLIFPSTSAMVPAIFYGFHETYLAIPLIALFFVALEERHLKTAVVLFALSLTIKETVAVFYIFMGPVLFIWGLRRFGSFIFLASLVYFLVTIKLLIPWISGYTQYEFVTSYYGGLGKSMTEIALSPIMAPSVFWPSLLHPNNLLFLALLLVPVTALLTNYPLPLFGGVGLFVFICLKDDKQLVTINSWYQSEVVILVFIASVYSLARVKERGPGVFLAFLLAGLKTKVLNRHGVRVRTALLISALCTSLLSFYFFNLFLPCGRNSWAKNIYSLSLQEYVREIYSVIPPGVPLNATHMIAAHFILRNTPCFSDPPKDFVLIDFGDSLTNSPQWETFRRRLLLSPNYSLVAPVFSNGRFALVLRKSPRSSQPKFTECLTDEQWQKTGIPFTINDASFSARYEKMDNDCVQGTKLVKIHLRLMKALDHDVNVVACVSDVTQKKPNQSKLTLPFGNGLNPCYLSAYGDTFSFIVPIPAKGTFSLTVDIAHKPPPDFSATAY